MQRMAGLSSEAQAKWLQSNSSSIIFLKIQLNFISQIDDEILTS